MGLIQALCTHRDTVVLDKLVHYSILDGVRLSGARWRTFRHSDLEHLFRVLDTVRAKQRTAEFLWSLKESMELTAKCRRYAICWGSAIALALALWWTKLMQWAWWGKPGVAQQEVHGIKHNSLIIMGSLSKSLGSFGGFIAAPAEIVDFLRYYARTITFSVGLPAGCVGGAMAGLEILHDHSNLLTRLRSNMRFFHSGLESFGVANAKKSGSAIFSAPVGDEGRLRDVARELFRRGVFTEGWCFRQFPTGRNEFVFGFPPPIPRKNFRGSCRSSRRFSPNIMWSPHHHRLPARKLVILVTATTTASWNCHARRQTYAVIRFVSRQSLREKLVIFAGSLPVGRKAYVLLSVQDLNQKSASKKAQPLARWGKFTGYPEKNSHLPVCFRKQYNGWPEKSFTRYWPRCNRRCSFRVEESRRRRTLFCFPDAPTICLARASDTTQDTWISTGHYPAAYVCQYYKGEGLR